MTLVAYDLDGTLIGLGGAPDGPCTVVDLTGCVIISGRTFAEYDQLCRELAQRVPVYIRGSGAYGDHEHAGKFKAAMIKLLGVNEFHEDHPRQVEIISKLCPDVTIVRHGRAADVLH